MNSGTNQKSRSFAFPLALLAGAGIAVSVALAADPPRGRLGDAESIQRRLDEGFRRVDANRNGTLEKREFIRAGEFAPRFKMDADAAEHVFNQLDKDGDGRINAVEFREFPRVQGMVAPAASERPAQKKEAAQPAAHGKALSAADVDFFEKKIRPVLVDKCYKCHSADADKVKGGLLVDTRDGIRNSGDNGHAVVPGNVKSSLLLRAIQYDDSDLQMPPKKEGGKLSDEIIADFEKWIAMGAPDPRDGKAVSPVAASIEKGREHWAFQPPQKSAPPRPKNSAWAFNDIDRFILADLEAKPLQPVADADPATLLRRVYFDLIGLPPSPEEVAAFVKECATGGSSASRTPHSALEKVVDRLLASPQFGERWGRHWLDVARYAESSGKENNIVYPHAWRYRDWVIQSFNEDKPYDSFLEEQIAGDLLPAADDTKKAEQLIATGFLAIGPKSHNTREFKQFQLDVADEQIDAVSQGMLGVTVSCARCHDHKFDPIPQMDYYAMAGIFLSTETRFGTPRFVQNNQTTPLIALPAKAKVTDAPALTRTQLAAMKEQLERETKTRDEMIAEARKKGERAPATNPQFLRATAQIGILEKQLARYDENGAPLPLAMGVQDKAQARDAQLLQRGELDKPQQTVPRGFVQVLARKESAPPKISRGSGRLELAGWIASPENPLTARVMVNRVWLNLFGAGIVPTPNNFGVMGQKPTNQPLLDHLAVEFVENGWSVKALIKQIVMSHTYRLSSEHHEANYAADPDNNLHWRMNRRRLDAEALRDAMLSVAGELDLTPPKASAIANFEGPVQQILRANRGPFGGGGGPAARFRGAAAGGESSNPLQQDRTYRSVYLPIVRDQVPDSLAVFDFAEPSLVIGEREETSVPAQALYLMNGSSVQKLAEAMTSRLFKTGARGTELTRRAFDLAFGRQPTAKELTAAAEFLERFQKAEAKNYSGKEMLGYAGVTAFCQALLGSAEFRYLY
jgi:cytochrome c553